jgi:hypothetical protein
MITADIFKQEKVVYIDMCISAHVFWPRLETARQGRQGFRPTPKALAFWVA